MELEVLERIEVELEVALAVVPAVVELAVAELPLSVVVAKADPVAAAVSLPVAVVTPVHVVAVKEHESRRLFTSVRLHVSDDEINHGPALSPLSESQNVATQASQFGTQLEDCGLSQTQSRYSSLVLCEHPCERLMV